MIGGVWAPVVGVEYLPVLEMADESLDWRAERRDLRVVFLVGQGEFAAFRLFLRCHQSGSLVALVAESAAGLLQDIRGPGLLECPRVMRLPGQRGGNPGCGAVEKGYKLRVKARGLVLFVPQVPGAPRRTSRASEYRLPGRPGP